MKNLTLFILCLPTLLCADLSFPFPYERFVKGDYIGALENYNAIITYKKNMTDLEVFEAVLGRSMCAMCVHGKDAALSDKMFQEGVKTEDREKYLDVLSKFIGFLRD